MKKNVRRGLKGIRAKPTEAFGNEFEALLVNLSANFLKSAQFKHAVTKGTERELVVKEFLSKFLPSVYAITDGEVIDIYDNRSNQLDIIIYDQSKNFPVTSGGSSIIPAEALLASIEVKSILNQKAIISSLESAKKLKKNLYPYNRKVVMYRNAGEPSDEKARYFYCIFAYTTDISGERSGWCKKEYARLMNLINDHNFSGFEIDRIYVANKGMIYPSEGFGIIERNDSGNALMTFLMHIYSFIQSENARRVAVPYNHYAGKLEKGTVSLPKKINKAYNLIKHPMRKGRKR